ncbi:MAG: hypothetical protein AMXMBFR83_01420, partial [Phycisphaerae bacterium]
AGGGAGWPGGSCAFPTARSAWRSPRRASGGSWPVIWNW